MSSEESTSACSICPYRQAYQRLQLQIQFQHDSLYGDDGQIQQLMTQQAELPELAAQPGISPRAIERRERRLEIWRRTLLQLAQRTDALQLPTPEPLVAELDCANGPYEQATELAHIRYCGSLGLTTVQRIETALPFTPIEE